MNHEEGRLRFLRRKTDHPRRRFRRGVYVLPSLFTLGNMFCGYACVVYAMRGEYETAAPFIGLAIVLDMLDGRIARLTGTASAFGLESHRPPTSNGRVRARDSSIRQAPAESTRAGGHYRRDDRRFHRRTRNGDRVGSGE